MTTGLFRGDPPAGYTLRERVDRTRVAALRDAIVAAGATTPANDIASFVAARGQNDFRRLVIAEAPGTPWLRSVVDQAFTAQGELGDIRALRLIRLSPEQRKHASTLRTLLSSSASPLAEHRLTVQAQRERGSAKDPLHAIDLRVEGEYDTLEGPLIGHADVRVYLQLGYVIPLWDDATEIAGRLVRAIEDAVGGDLVSRRLSEAEILLLWEFTGGVGENFQIASGGYEAATEAVQNRARSRGNIELSEKINQDQRKYGPLDGVTVRASWIRDSRGRRLDTTVRLRSDGSVVFGARVEPHVVDQLVTQLVRLDRSPVLSRGILEILGDTYVALTTAGSGASLPEYRSYIQEAQRRVESHLKTRITADAGFPALTDRRCQQIANLVFATTIAIAHKRLKGSAAKLSAKDHKYFEGTFDEMKDVFRANVFPASGAEPSTPDLSGALGTVLQIVERHRTDVPALFEELRTLL